MDEEALRIVNRFQMQPHPEGGFFREVYRSETEVAHPGIPAEHGNLRSSGTFIYFLLGAGQFSAFHRVKQSDEIWHLYAGGPLELHTIGRDGHYECRLLTTAVDRGEPSAVVKAGDWQAARPEAGAAWIFAGCTVTPGFDFEDFEMPPRQALLDDYPDQAAIVRELTRR